MIDDSSDPVALEYAPPVERRRRALLMLLLSLAFGAVHLIASIGVIHEWDFLRTYTPELLSPFLFFPLHVADDLGLIRQLPWPVIVFVVVPLNSIAYGVGLATVVFVVCRLARRMARR